MEIKLTQLKSDFHNIINIRTIVKNIFDILQIRINKLKSLYNDFIKTSKTQLSVFGLDSFHFQNKLIDIEYDEMKRLFLAINNRMYCEYFKLYKIIIDYILSNNYDKKITELVKIKDYPTYKDLEPFKEYKFELILDIHENIINLLSILYSALINKENELVLHKNNQSIGLNINNFVTTFSYNIIVMKEKITLFITYIEFFHKLHTTYLKRFANKIQLMYSHINNDIHFDKNIDENNKNIFNENNNSISNEDSNNSIEDSSDNESNISNNSVKNKSIDELFNNRSRTNSGISNNTSNKSITPKFTLKNIESTISKDDLNDMFSNIDLSCESIIKNNIPEIILVSPEKYEEPTKSNYNITPTENIIITGNEELIFFENAQNIVI
jgi:hypothetical protein